MSTLSVNPGTSGAPGVSGAQRATRSRAAQKARELGVRTFLIACASFSILTTFAIIYILLDETIRFFGLPEVTVSEFFTGLEWKPLLGSTKHFGIWPLVAGTLLVTVIAMAVALPLGLSTAIFLSEYAPRRVRAVLKPMLELLAGIPTVVYGFFALTVVTPLLQGISSVFETYNAMSAGVAVGIMCLPIVSSLSEDALQAVPRSLREGAYAVGATKFDVSVRVVLPAAISGIVAAFLLAIARAVGETMIVALAAGNLALDLKQDPASAVDPTGQAQTMTAYMVQIFLGDVSNFGAEYLSSYAVAAMLFVMTFILTVVGHRVRVRFREAYE